MAVLPEAGAACAAAGVGRRVAAAASPAAAGPAVPMKPRRSRSMVMHISFAVGYEVAEGRPNTAEPRPSPPFPVTPAKAGVHSSAIGLSGRWIPAFAGMTRKERTDFLSFHEDPSGLQQREGDE